MNATATREWYCHHHPHPATRFDGLPHQSQIPTCEPV